MTAVGHVDEPNVPAVIWFRRNLDCLCWLTVFIRAVDCSLRPVIFPQSMVSDAWKQASGYSIGLQVAPRTVVSWVPSVIVIRPEQ
jgi:hypothetical protein